MLTQFGIDGLCPSRQVVLPVPWREQEVLHHMLDGNDLRLQLRGPPDRDSTECMGWRLEENSMAPSTGIATREREPRPPVESMGWPQEERGSIRGLLARD